MLPFLYLLVFRSLTANEILKILEDNEDKEYRTANSIDVFIALPGVKEDTDERSGDKDRGGTYTIFSNILS